MHAKTVGVRWCTTMEEYLEDAPDAQRLPVSPVQEVLPVEVTRQGR